jgi:hypothetical protein
MPSYPSNVNPGWFLPTTEIIGTDLIIEAAKDNVLLQQVLIQVIKSIGNLNKTVNGKSTGIRALTEFVNGNTYYLGTNATTGLSSFIKMIDFGTISNIGVNTVPHGIDISINQNFTFVDIYGVATDPVGLQYIPLPFASSSGTENIQLNVTATDIVITTPIDRSAFTRTLVFVEYLKNL